MSGEGPVRIDARNDQLRCTTAIGQPEWDMFVDGHPEAAQSRKREHRGVVLALSYFPEPRVDVPSDLPRHRVRT